MAEIQEKSKGGGKQKKKHIHLDFTPMVDMNMLLITFFMLCTSLSKPQTMEISMPSKDKVPEEEQTKVQDTRAITLLLDGDNKIFYYFGEPNFQNYNSLVQTSYEATGIRQVLLKRNKKVNNEMNDLKREKIEKKLTDEEFTTRSTEIKKDKSAPVVIIKATDKANYKNLIDALDEMQICSISKYAVVDITEADEFLLQNWEAKGGLIHETVTE
ncbi:MAG TPA: biopolymer transporter ExbD [Paludibacteraceae bacterium]|jgi:biopolymer transport protein ExbD|nr:biopolymer transporter ExbD [Paludibacteraceae bacterium]HPH63202.1 biopolymer transporter ExbD [Paludibacteraceae bacterium]